MLTIFLSYYFLLSSVNLPLIILLNTEIPFEVFVVLNMTDKEDNHSDSGVSSLLCFTEIQGPCCNRNPHFLSL